MVLLMVAAAAYAVLQLALVTMGSRTLRTSTILLAVAAGGYGCGVFAIGSEMASTRVVVAVTGDSMFLAVRAASYTVDPIIEELVKLAPMIVILVGLVQVRRQWSLVDYAVVGAATGSGFGLAEALLRYSGQAAQAVPDRHGGFLVPTSLDAPSISGLTTLLPRWLPAPVDTWDLFGITGDGLNYHLLWSALAGLGFGILVRGGGRRRCLGLVPIAYAGADHVAMNYALRHLGANGATEAALAAANGLRGALPAVVLVAVSLAIAHDLLRIRRVRCCHPSLLLRAERETPVRLVALIRIALVAPPWTFLVVSRFVLLRRAAWNDLASPGSRRASTLSCSVAQMAQLLDHAGDRDRWRRAAVELIGNRRPTAHLVRDWRVLVWVILLVPAVAYLVVGAAPATSGLQTILASDAGLIVLKVASVGAVVFLTGQLIGTGRQLRPAGRQPHGEGAIRAILSLATGLGALAGGGVLLIRSFTSPQVSGRVFTNFHILEALSTIALVAALALFLAALIYFPPLALVGLAEGGAIIVVTQAAATSAGMIAGAAALGSLGVLLNEASDAPGLGPVAPVSKGSAPKEGVRLDPATEAKVRKKLPTAWGEGHAVRKGTGTRWLAPGNNGVRVDKGNPNSPYPSQRVDHVIVNYKGDVIGPDGGPILRSIKKDWQAHIPLTDWLKWSRWWRP